MCVRLNGSNEVEESWPCSKKNTETAADGGFCSFRIKKALAANFGFFQSRSWISKKELSIQTRDDIKRFPHRRVFSIYLEMCCCVSVCACACVCLLMSLWLRSLTLNIFRAKSKVFKKVKWLKTATKCSESKQNSSSLGRGCGAVGRAVSSDTRDPQFESHQIAKFWNLFTLYNCSEKTNE